MNTFCVCVCVAMVVTFKELEQSGSHPPWLHGLPNLRRGQGPTAQVHPQTRQVRHRRALRITDNPKHFSEHFLKRHFYTIIPCGPKIYGTTEKNSTTA